MATIDRLAIYQRDGGLCGFCGEPVPIDRFHLDHVQPKALGGPTTEDNLRVAHRRCNIEAGHSVVAERRRLGLPAVNPDLKTIRIPASLYVRAVKAARAEDRTLSQLTIYALRRYVNEQERQRDGD